MLHSFKVLRSTNLLIAIAAVLYNCFTELAESLAFNLYGVKNTEMSRFRIGIGVYAGSTALAVHAYLPST